MVFGSFGFSSDNSNIARIADTVDKDNAEKQKACTESVRQWWLELQHQLEAENSKTSEENGDAKPFLLQTTDTLQPLVDIAFFRYWDLEQVRKDGERYIPVEASLRLMDDLLRENEDACLAGLKDYLKYKMYAGMKDETVAAKKTSVVDAQKKLELDKFDLETALDAATVDSVDKLEEAIKIAKEASVDTKDAEEKAAKLKADKESKDAAAKDLETATAEATADKINDLDKLIGKAKALGVDTASAAEKAQDLKDVKKGVKEEVAAAAKEKKKKEDAEKKEKDDAAKAEALAKTTEERAALRISKEKETETAAAADFATQYMKAAEEIVDDLVAKYKKKPFCSRQAAITKFGEYIGSKEEGTITQNELNKFFNLADAEKFNAVCSELGFNPDCLEAVLSKVAEGEEKKEEASSE